MSHDTDPDRPAIMRVLGMVAREQVTGFIRITSATLAVSMFFLGYGPLVDSARPAYQAPVFDGVWWFASPTAWGVGFMLSASLLGVAALSGRAVVYITGVTVASFTLAAWSGMVILESLTNPDAALTSGAIGLYIGTFVGLVGIALSPRQIVAERPILAVLDDETDPVPLRRIS